MFFQRKRDVGIRFWPVAAQEGAHTLLMTVQLPQATLSATFLSHIFQGSLLVFLHLPTTTGSVPFSIYKSCYCNPPTRLFSGPNVPVSTPRRMHQFTTNSPIVCLSLLPVASVMMMGVQQTKLTRVLSCASQMREN